MYFSWIYKKTFDTIDHNLLTAKLEVYGVPYSTLK